MICPHCKSTELRINVIATGTVIVHSDLQNPGKFEIAESEMLDSEWDDSSDVYCFGCGQDSTVAECTAAYLHLREDVKQVDENKAI